MLRGVTADLQWTRVSSPSRRICCSRSSWSLELYQQTNARLWRQGQTADTVVVQHIITKGTIDSQMLKALSAKDRTQSALIAAVKADLKI